MKNVFWLSVISLVFLFSVSGSLQENGLWWDESIYLGLAENIHENGSYEFNVGNQERFRAPVFPLVLASAYKLNQSETTAHVLNYGFVIVLILLFYALIRKMHRKNSLLGAALVLAASDYLFWSSKILSEPLAILLITLSMYLFWLAVEEKKYNLLILVGLSSGLAFLTRYPSIILGLFFMAYILWRKKFIIFRKKELYLGLLAFLIAILPWLSMSYLNYGDPLGAIKYNLFLVNDVNYQQDFFYYLNNIISGYPLLALFSLAGIFIAFKNRKKEDVYFLLWFLTVLVFMSFFVGQKEFRYFAMSLPSLVFLGLLGIETVSQRVARDFRFDKKHSAWLLCVIVAVTALSGALSAKERIENDLSSGLILRDAGEYIKENAPEGSGVLSQNYAVLHYYTKHPVGWYPADEWAVDEFIEKYKVSYVVLDNIVYYPEWSEEFFDSSGDFELEFEKRDKRGKFVKVYRVANFSSALIC